MVSSDTAFSDTELFDFDPQVLLGGRYQIIQQLAEGTFGHTYLARDWHLPDHPICVIKQLKPQSDGEEMKTAQRLFEAEARALAKLGSHSQIPHLLAHFVEHEEFFLVQEYIKGRSLNNEIVSGTPWPEARVIDLLEEILEVLSFVHQQNVIHRDIKPANLIRRYGDGRVVLIDFGAVKALSTAFLHPTPGETDLTIAIGTAGYIPKEQVGGRPRYSSDVYSAGVLGIQALTGISPQQFSEDRWSGEIEWHGLAPHVSPEFAQILDRMTRYDFRDRYRDAAAALHELKQLPLHLRQAEPQAPSLAEPTLMSPNGATLPPTVFQGTDRPASPPQGDSAGQTETAINHNQPRRQSPSGRPSVVSADAAGPTIESPQATPQVSNSQGDMALHPSARPYPKPAQRRFLSRRHQRPLPTAQADSSASSQWFQELTTMARWNLLRWRQRRLHLWYLTGIAGLISGLAVLPLISRQPLSVSANSINTAQLLNSAEKLLQQVPIQDSLKSNVSLQLNQLIGEATKLETNGRYSEALEAYRRALAIDSADLSALQGRCRTLNALAQGEMALEACNDLLAVAASDPTGQWGIAEANSRMQLFDKSLALFNQGLDQHPNFAPLWKDRAELLWRLGNSDAAIASLEQALVLKPDDREALALRQAWLGF
ncbi:MAG: protein kinase [Elainellaceae cyanobacterium]